MIWPVRSIVYGHASRLGRSAYTLIEILVSTALTLMLLMAVVQIFGTVSEGIANSRSALEMADQLRAAQTTLQRDLEGVTVTMSPPRRPESGEGYFEYTEGPIGPVVSPSSVASNTNTPDGVAEPDSTVGDIDDMLLFTTRTRTTPFVGRGGLDGNGKIIPVESQEAEVAWFLRGHTLYRRVLLVLPNATLPGTASGFYHDYDISVRNNAAGTALAANSLSDLTKPENRCAHRIVNGLPYHPHFTIDSGVIVRSQWANLGLPTLRECSYVHPTDPTKSWIAGRLLPTINLGSPGVFDVWLNPHPSPAQDRDTGALSDFLGDRIGEDVILTNVIGFDVKAWDPGAPVMMLQSGHVLLPGDPGYFAAVQTYVTGSQTGTPPCPVSYGAYVDLNYLCLLGFAGGLAEDARPAYSNNLKPAGIPDPQFHWAGDKRSRVRGANPATAPGTTPRSAVYDTWSTHYECDGVDNDNRDGDGNDATGADEGTDGFDNDGNGVVDDAIEQEAPPPYPTVLRGIQVRIRVFEPASRQIREVTVVQDFLPK